VELHLAHAPGTRITKNPSCPKLQLQLTKVTITIVRSYNYKCPKLQLLVSEVTITSVRSYNDNYPKLQLQMYVIQLQLKKVTITNARSYNYVQSSEVSVTIDQILNLKLCMYNCLQGL
jgi:hypothetical protein